MVSITTYNIRLDTDDDHPWQWAARKPYVLANLQRLDPDIFTVEEAEPHQLADLRTLTAYRGFGVPRENTVDQGEAAAIFIKKTKFDALAEGHAWVSKTPDKPSIYPGAWTYRMFQWAKLRDKTDDTIFYLVTVHLDHVSVAARNFGVQQILAAFAQERADYPFIVTGDFNMTPRMRLTGR